MLNKYYRRIWITVALGCFLATVVFGFRAADEYVAVHHQVKDMQQLQRQWGATQVKSNELQEAEQQVDSLLNDLEPRNLRDERLADLRDKVVELVRLSGCRLRKIQLAAATKRQWGGGNDDPHAAAMAQDDLPSRYELHTYVLELRIDGPLQDIQNWMASLASQRLLLTTDVMTLSLVDETGHISLSLRATLYGLADAPEDFIEEI